MQSSILLTDLLTVNCAFSLFLTHPPYPEGRSIPEALAEETNFRVGYVMYPTLWGIGVGHIVGGYYCYYYLSFLV